MLSNALHLSMGVFHLMLEDSCISAQILFLSQNILPLILNAFRFTNIQLLSPWIAFLFGTPILFCICSRLFLQFFTVLKSKTNTFSQFPICMMNWVKGNWLQFFRINTPILSQYRIICTDIDNFSNHSF